MTPTQTTRNSTLVIGALGIVFGDIGTSPIYAVKACFSDSTGLAINPDNVLGILSMIFWLLTIIVSIKYVSFVMRADNRGEGGILSLHALALHATNKFLLRRFFIILGLLGAGLFYGDSLITPAISVLSAIEGIEVVAPDIEHMILPITIGILLTLFAMQKHGTASIGKYFGIVMCIWFGALAVMGGVAIAGNPQVLAAINPIYALGFILAHKAAMFPIIGAVVLAVTGAEALYADMGHFGQKPIRQAWFYVAMPALLINYFGQGALLLSNPATVQNPFYLMAPTWFQTPLVFLAAAATVIASQATISGAFSITRQAIQLGYLPRMTITHTSEHEAGQIYIPAINTMLMVAITFLVLGFKSSDALASAYGISVVGVMVITTLLFYQVMRGIWKWPLWASLSICTPLLCIDLFLLAGNVTKIAEGGWFTLLVAACIFVLMIIWLDGNRFLYKQITNTTMPLNQFLADMDWNETSRVPGTGIFLVRTAGDAPHALLRNVRHNRVVHERVIILHIANSDVPTIKRSKRYTITHLDHGFISIQAHYGFMELPSIPLLFKQIVGDGTLQIDMADTSFFVSCTTLVIDPHMGLPLWKAFIYKAMQVNAVQAYDFYRIPTKKVVEIGIQMRI